MENLVTGRLDELVEGRHKSTANDVEHHLFPRVAHTHYPQIAEIVQRNAAKHGIRYTAQPSLRAALASHKRHLRTLGRMGTRAEIEMG